ncbi:MAG: KH domain-containing protein [Planctomycetota bacterium]
MAILDEKGRPISGFDSSDCDPITGDYIERAVSWKGNTGVGQLAGKVVRLKFQMQNAKLYAFKFEP